jgi:hypothetical protein
VAPHAGFAERGGADHSQYVLRARSVPNGGTVPSGPGLLVSRALPEPDARLFLEWAAGSEEIAALTAIRDGPAAGPRCGNLPFTCAPELPPSSRGRPGRAGARAGRLRVPGGSGGVRADHASADDAGRTDRGSADVGRSVHF